MLNNIVQNGSTFALMGKGFRFANWKKTFFSKITIFGSRYIPYFPARFVS